MAFECWRSIIYYANVVIEPFAPTPLCTSTRVPAFRARTAISVLQERVGRTGDFGQPHPYDDGRSRARSTQALLQVSFHRGEPARFPAHSGEPHRRADYAIVDKFAVHFTHTTEIDWLLPGVPPTGRVVEVPTVGIVNFQGDKLVHEHIYWDQTSVLVQVGLLDLSTCRLLGRKPRASASTKISRATKLMSVEPKVRASRYRSRKH